MAIPSTPQNFYSQQGNRQIYLSWDLTAGATSYDVQRSTDGVTYASVSSAAPNNYLDTSVTVGTQYFYKIAAINGSGTSPYTAPQSLVPTPTGEMSLGEIRTQAQQRADRLNSNFVTLPEWNSYINHAMYELYDMLITQYEDYFKAPGATFITNGVDMIYPLPNGLTQFYNDQTALFTAQPFYKLLGVDLAVNTANNAYVTINKYNYIDRNRFVYPNTASTIYGVFNLQYRMMGTNIEFIPTPASGQKIRLQYIPRLAKLLQDSDLTTTGISDWNEYIILKAAILALTKEESDTSKLESQLMFQVERIMDSSMNRDVGQADSISDTRQGFGSGNWGGSRNGPVGGF